MFSDRSFLEPPEVMDVCEILVDIRTNNFVAMIYGCPPAFFQVSCTHPGNPPRRNVHHTIGIQGQNNKKSCSHNKQIRPVCHIRPRAKSLMLGRPASNSLMLGQSAVPNMLFLAHQNRTIAIAGDFCHKFCVDGAKSPEILQKEGVWGSEIATRNRNSLATFHRTLKSQ